MEWIDCKTMMPPINKQVLAYGPCMGSLIGGLNIDICIWDGQCWWDDGGTELVSWGDERWTHWMELPDPPNRGDRNES